MKCCDAIAAAGVSGLMDPVQAGLACGSDTAHMSMFGYDPRTYYRGRGAFETMGAGLDMLPGDIAFKVLFDFFALTSGVLHVCVPYEQSLQRRAEVCPPEARACIVRIVLHVYRSMLGVRRVDRQNPVVCQNESVSALHYLCWYMIRLQHTNFMPAVQLCLSEYEHANGGTTACGSQL